jgi:hypothetical protein
MQAAEKNRQHAAGLTETTPTVVRRDLARSLRRKAGGFPQVRRQSRYFTDFDATLRVVRHWWTSWRAVLYIRRRYV